MGLIDCGLFQFFFGFCVVVIWNSLVHASDTLKLQSPDRRLSDHRFSTRIIFPEQVVPDKYDYLFSPVLPDYQQKINYRKEYRFKPYLARPKSILRYNNYRKIPDGPRVILYTPNVGKDSLYQITQSLLKGGNPGNKFNDDLHDPGVKPVVEHIQDDIKYDFRTKTHYYEK